MILQNLITAPHCGIGVNDGIRGSRSECRWIWCFIIWLNLTTFWMLQKLNWKISFKFAITILSVYNFFNRMKTIGWKIRIIFGREFWSFRSFLTLKLPLYYVSCEDETCGQAEEAEEMSFPKHKVIGKTNCRLRKVSNRVIMISFKPFCSFSTTLMFGKSDIWYWAEISVGNQFQHPDSIFQSKKTANSQLFWLIYYWQQSQENKTHAHKTIPQVKTTN